MKTLVFASLLLFASTLAASEKDKGRAAVAVAIAQGAMPTKAACNCSADCPCPCRSGGVCECDKQAPARVEVTLPADAELMIDGKATQQVGPVRTFVSPPIKCECSYTLTYRIWRGGKGWEETATVAVWPGQTSRVTLGATGPMVAAQPAGWWYERGRQFYQPQMMSGNCGPGG